MVINIAVTIAANRAVASAYLLVRISKEATTIAFHPAGFDKVIWVTAE